MKPENPGREAAMLKMRRKELDYSQLDVAQTVGIQVQHYQRYESGERQISKAGMKLGLRICAVLEIDPYELVFENGVDLAGGIKKK